MSRTKVVDQLQPQVQISHGITVSETEAPMEIRGGCLRNRPDGSRGSDSSVGCLYCFSTRIDCFLRSVRVARSELTKKRGVGVEKVSECGKSERN